MMEIGGGELVDGLDKFYSDSRNRTIMLSNASTVFVNSVAGMPRDALLRLIEQYRKPGC